MAMMMPDTESGYPQTSQQATTVKPTVAPSTLIKPPAPTPGVLPQPGATTPTVTGATSPQTPMVLPMAPGTQPVSSINLANPGAVQPGGGYTGGVTSPVATGSATSPVASATVQPFGPGSDLRFQQVTPTTSPAVAQAQQTTTGLASQLGQGGQLAPWQSIQSGSYAPTDAAEQARAQAQQMLAQLGQSPDRFQLAQERFGAFADQTQGAYDGALRSATQRAAANGRLNSGMLTSEYGDFALQRQRDLDASRTGLFTNALEGTIQDRLNNLGATSNLAGQFRGEDLAQSGFQQGLRMEDRGERASQYGYETQNLQNLLASLGGAQSVEQQRYGQATGERGEIRDERDYQNQVGQQALQQQLVQWQQEQAAQQQAFGQQYQTAGLAGQLGFQGNPANALMSGSQQYGDQASASNAALMQLLAQYGYGG